MSAQEVLRLPAEQQAVISGAAGKRRAEGKPWKEKGSARRSEDVKKKEKWNEKERKRELGEGG